MSAANGGHQGILLSDAAPQCLAHLPNMVPDGGHSHVRNVQDHGQLPFCSNEQVFHLVVKYVMEPAHGIVQALQPGFFESQHLVGATDQLGTEVQRYQMKQEGEQNGFW